MSSFPIAVGVISFSSLPVTYIAVGVISFSSLPVTYIRMTLNSNEIPILHSNNSVG